MNNAIKAALLAIAIVALGGLSEVRGQEASEVTVENPCAVPAPTVLSYYRDFADGPGGFYCDPAPIGTGSNPTIRMNAYGATMYWSCRDPLGGSRIMMSAITWAKVRALSVGGAPSKPANGSSAPVANQVALALVDSRMADPELAKVWCPWAKEMKASVPVEPPPVVASGTLVTASKSTFTAVGNALGSPAGTVALGVKCNCAARQVLLGSYKYCTFAGAASTNVVAVCKPAP